MAKKKNKMWWLLGGAALLLFYGKKAVTNAYNNLTMGKSRITLGKLTGFNVPIKVHIPIINGNDIAFPFTAFSATLFYGEQPLGPVTNNTPVSIAAKATTELHFDTQIGILNAGAVIEDAIKTGNYLRPFTLKGTITINGVPVPYYQTLEVL